MYHVHVSPSEILNLVRQQLPEGRCMVFVLQAVSLIPLVAMADSLWNLLVDRLGQHNLLYLDLPENEALLYGTLEELGFHSILDRDKMRKEINQKRVIADKSDSKFLTAPINQTLAAIAHYAHDQVPSGEPSDMLVLHDDGQNIFTCDSSTNGGLRL